MNVGDKAWVFHVPNQTILECAVDFVGMKGYVLNAPSSGKFFRLKEEVFPTREALCEHYRRIFE